MIFFHTAMSNQVFRVVSIALMKSFHFVCFLDELVNYFPYKMSLYT